jgi:hypothetical protein
MIVDPGYLKSLHRPNVTLNHDAIERIVPRGVQLKTGEVVPLDVLIFGTGFSLVRLHMSLVNWKITPLKIPLVSDSCPLAWRSLASGTFGLLTTGSRKVVPKRITDSRCRSFLTTLCFSVCLARQHRGSLETNLVRTFGVQGRTAQVDTRPLSSSRKCRCV